MRTFILKTSGCFFSSVMLVAVSLGATAAEPRPEPKNHLWNPLGAGNIDRWTAPIATYAIINARENPTHPERWRAAFKAETFAELRAKVAKRPLARVVKVFESEEDKRAWIKIFGEKEANETLDLFITGVSLFPGVSEVKAIDQLLTRVEWVRFVDQLVGNTAPAKEVSKTRTSFSNVAAIGGKIVYHEGLLQAKDGQWMLVRGLYYTVAMGREFKVLPLYYSRILVETVD